MSEDALQKRLSALQGCVPESGYNLVVLDDHEDEPGHEVHLIAHFPSGAEADAALLAYRRNNPRAIVHVYGPPIPVRENTEPPT